MEEDARPERDQQGEEQEGAGRLAADGESGGASGEPEIDGRPAPGGSRRRAGRLVPGHRSEQQVEAGQEEGRYEQIDVLGGRLGLDDRTQDEQAGGRHCGGLAGPRQPREAGDRDRADDREWHLKGIDPRVGSVEQREPGADQLAVHRERGRVDVELVLADAFVLEPSGNRGQVIGEPVPAVGRERVGDEQSPRQGNRRERYERARPGMSANGSRHRGRSRRGDRQAPTPAPGERDHHQHHRGVHQENDAWLQRAQDCARDQHRADDLRRRDHTGGEDPIQIAAQIQHGHQPIRHHGHEERRDE